ncbi:Hypothetical_protein [Hexamita inflata]|uniref:Hypothetical_protein n=1 Tax=Hexamita inflata TaxID=28002 RepID=A0AA86PV37_9EUKA|nr:Hypothetical protein HINF_LOCUS29575 [Hexamita inflata]
MVIFFEIKERQIGYTTLLKRHVNNLHYNIKNNCIFAKLQNYSNQLINQQIVVKLIVVNSVQSIQLKHVIHSYPDKLERNPTFIHTCHTGGDSNEFKNAQQNNSNKNPRPTTKTQIAFGRIATPENRKQDSQFMTLFPGLNLEQIRNNANTITRNSPTQPKAVINKKISKTNSISPKKLTESL